LVNITDGINGLVPSMFLYSCFYYLLKGYSVLDPFFQFFIILSCLGMLIFLLPNFFGLCFLGNSGSYLVAIIISVFYTQLYMKQVVEYSDILLIFIIPLIDGLRVTIYRIINRKNPFIGDLTHIHHIIRSNKLMVFLYFIIVFLPSLVNFYFVDYTIYTGLISLFIYLIFYKYSVRYIHN
jgi:UDP-N-acetylmuramyl pentapeptide phosphotransferase/UDP-N-acetylglucosamine-1-phosphate transferase